MTTSINHVLTETVQAVVLDLDGTLYDKRHIARRLVMQHLCTLPLLAAEQNARKRLKGQHFGTEAAFYDSFFRRMAQTHLYTPRIARCWYFRVYMPSMVRTIRRRYRLNAWVEPLLTECRKRHIRIAVYSDYGCVPEKLAALGLHTDRFDVVVSAPQLGGLKPARESAARVVEMLNVPAGNCLFIGDRDDTDGASARAVGAKFYLIDNH
ncbi:MAG: HAD family hydrolase [Paludibacteraceae bacterium]